MRWAALAALFIAPAFISVHAGAGAPPTPCGPSWSTVTSPNPTTGTNRLLAVSSQSAAASWAAGYSVDGSGNELPLVARWDGSAWTGANIAAGDAGNSRLTGVVAIATDDVVAVGYTVKGDGSVVPLIERWNGTSWTASNPDAGTGDHHLLGVTATSSSDVTAVGYTTDGGAETPLILRWNGAGWNASNPDAGTGDHRLEGVAAISASDIVAVGRTSTATGTVPLVLRWNGSAWASDNPDAGSGDHELRAVAAVSSSDVTAVGFSTTVTGSAPLVMHWNGSSWTADNPASSGELNGVAALAADDVWAVGRTPGSPDTTLALHWGGSSWSPSPTPNGSGASNLAGVAASAPLDLWAVGGDATSTLVEHYLPCAPSVGTDPATGVTQTGATLHASVIPNGVATDVHFEYGTTTAYGTPTAPSAIGSGTSIVPVSKAIGSLSPGTTYHARVVATSSAGTTNGEDVTFTTATGPTVSLAPTTTSVTEGDSGSKAVTLTASLSAPSSQTVTVQWATADGSASAGSDYTGASGTLTFTPGDVSETFTVSVLGDDLDEGDESFSVSLSAPVNASLGSASSTVTITDDDVKPAATTDPATGTTQTGATLAGTVNPNGKATSYHFEYGTTTGYGASTTTAAAGSGTSAVPVSAPVSGLSPGVTYHFRVVATSAAGTTNGQDRSFVTSSTPTVSLGPSATSVTEGDSGSKTVTLTASLSAPSTQTVTAQWATADGSATAGLDYTAASGTVTFAPGDVSETFSVSVLGDDLDEGDETFTVSLSAPTNAALGAASVDGDDHRRRHEAGRHDRPGDGRSRRRGRRWPGR